MRDWPTAMRATVVSLLAAIRLWGCEADAQRFGLAPEAEASEVSLSLFAQKQEGDVWRLYVGVRNQGGVRANVKFYPSVIVRTGATYMAEQFESEDILATPYREAMVTRDVSLTGKIQGISGIELPPAGYSTVPLVCGFRFRLPAGVEPVRFALWPEGPSAEVAGLPRWPVISSPRAKTALQPPGIEISIKEVAHAVKLARKGGSALDELDLLLWRNFVDASGKIKTVKSSVVTLTDFAAESGGVWVAASLLLKNTSPLRVEFPLHEIGLVSNSGEKCSPVGRVAEKGSGEHEIRLGSPFPDKLLLEGNSTVPLELIYQAKRFWGTEYTLAWSEPGGLEQRR